MDPICAFVMQDFMELIVKSTIHVVHHHAQMVEPVSRLEHIRFGSASVPDFLQVSIQNRLTQLK